MKLAQNLGILGQLKKGWEGRVIGETKVMGPDWEDQKKQEVSTTGIEQERTTHKGRAWENGGLISYLNHRTERGGLKIAKKEDRSTSIENESQMWKQG